MLFNGEAYVGKPNSLASFTGIAVTDSMATKLSKREELRSALVEIWELLKHGGE